MTVFEMVIVVGGVVVMRFFIKDNATYLFMSAVYGGVLGIISGLAKAKKNE